jgi:glyceraldehyde 3-phosphate dehydrogenase
MAVRVAINGFGRVGRYLVRACMGRDDIKIIAINTRADAKTIKHLLKYDSVHGKIHADLAADKGSLVVDGNEIKVTSITDDPSTLPWGELNIDVVMETTGGLRTREKAFAHIQAGAKKVIIGAPGKGVDGTFVMGVNEKSYDPEKHHVVSNASCTTNCLAPVAKVINDKFSIVRGFMTTVHSYTMDQRLLDGSHKDLRRARAAAMSIVPTSTGAAVAVADVIPDLKGKLDGLALRVPTPNVSLVDLVVEVKNQVTAEEVNKALKSAAEGELKGIMAFCEEELVSVDFTSDAHSSIVDASLTKVMDGNLIKVFSWYDNESGYSCRMRDLAVYMCK